MDRMIGLTLKVRGSATARSDTHERCSVNARSCGATPRLMESSNKLDTSTPSRRLNERIAGASWNGAKIQNRCGPTRKGTGAVAADDGKAIRRQNTFLNCQCSARLRRERDLLTVCSRTVRDEPRRLKVSNHLLTLCTYMSFR